MNTIPAQSQSPNALNAEIDQLTSSNHCGSALKLQIDSGELSPWPEDYAQYYRAKGYWREHCLLKILTDSVQRRPHAPAVIAGDQRWTYSQLYQRSQQLAAGLQHLGIRNNDKILVQIPNQAECVEVFFALMTLGAIPILALPTHRHKELRDFIQQTQAKAYIGFEPTQSLGLGPTTLESPIGGFNRIGDVITLVDHVIVVGAKEIAAKPRMDCTHNTIVRLHDLYRETLTTTFPAINPNQIALLQLSGGTTSTPKLIPRTHNDYFYSIRRSIVVSALTPQSVYLAVLPATHNFTLSSPGILGTLAAGGCVVMSPTNTPQVSLPLINEHKVSHCALVPPLATSWLQHLQNAKNMKVKTANISSLKVLQVGGSKLSSITAKQLKQLFACQIQQVFGMAEGLVNYTRLNDSDEKVFGTQGCPMSEADEIRIVDDHGQPVRIGDSGHLLTRGPYTIRGYYRAEHHNTLAFTQHGFYRTGDIASQTPEGYLIVEGRHKDQINRGGEKISASEIEEQLCAHPEVIDAAVVAMEDVFLGERSCAYIQTKNRQHLSLVAIRSYLRGRGLAEYKLPDRIEITHQFPKSSVGKIDKKLLRNMINLKIQEATLKGSAP